MIAEVITVGDEILIGQIVNTNASWLAGMLTSAGFSVREMCTTGDDIDSICRAIESASHRSDFIVVTGGLGPTHDDITRDAVAEAFDTDLYFDERTFGNIRQRFERRGRSIPESNRAQAMVPKGFEILDNDMGSAPGLWYDFDRNGSRKTIVVVPGVPREMKWLISKQVLPRIRERGDLPGIIYRTLSTTGIGESNFQDLIRPVLDTFPDSVRVAFLPNLDGVRLRLGISREAAPDANKVLDTCENDLRTLADRFIYSAADESLEQAVHALLIRQNLTLGIAESCTGGLIASRLTDIAGSSAFLKGAVVAYSNTAKRTLLHVKEDSFEASGAVSSEVAAEMARGARKQFDADIGMSSTGIMGPSGGSDEKPVGTVWFGVDSASGTETHHHVFGTERLGNKRRASTMALNLLRLMLMEGEDV